VPVQRTTIVLPLNLKRSAAEAARHGGISFGEFVRRAVRKELAEAASQGGGRRKDPFLDDTAVYRGRGPKNYARDHDKYLYGE